MKKYIALLLTIALLVTTVFSVVVLATGEDEAPEAETEEAVVIDDEEATEEEEGESSELVVEREEGDIESGSMINRDFVLNYQKETENKPADNTSIGSEFTLITENDQLELYAITTNEDFRMGEILIRDKATGYVWRSNPEPADDPIGKASGQAYNRNHSQIVIAYSKGFNAVDINSDTDSVKQNLIECTVGNNYVRFVYRFRNLEFVVPVQYSLTDEGLKAELLLNDEDARFTYTVWGSIAVGHLGEKVAQEVDYNITRVDLLPAFGATTFNENGYMFIPDGSGALVNMNNGKMNISQPYRQPIYGKYKESTAEEYNLKASSRYFLPVFGVVKDDGHALMGIVEENAAVGYVGVEVSGYESAYNKVYASYLNKIISSSDKEGLAQPLSNEVRDKQKNFTVNYYCLSDDEANYVGMAKRYRRYLVEEQGMEKIDDVRDGSLILDLYAGVEKKTSILGIPWNIFEVMTTYDDVQRIADDMLDAGITDISIRYNDWTDKSNRKKVQNDLNFESAIGGRKGFNETAKYLAEKNVGFYPNIDFINFSENGHGYSRFADAVKYTTQAPAYQNSGFTSHTNLGTRWCLLKADKVYEVATKFLEGLKKNGNVTGISLENICRVAYSDGSHNGITRSECVSYWQKLMKAYKDSGIKLLSERPNAYAIESSDILMEIPSKESFVEIADEAVPFYQIAVRGYRNYTTENVNMASTPENIILNAVETGSGLLYSLVARDTTNLKETHLKYLYSCNYDQWKDSIIEEYKPYNEVMQKINGADIADHEKLENGVYKTSFDNGVAVYVNYTDEDAATKSGQVIPAKGYIAERGE